MFQYSRCFISQKLSQEITQLRKRTQAVLSKVEEPEDGTEEDFESLQGMIDMFELSEHNDDEAQKDQTRFNDLLVRLRLKVFQDAGQQHAIQAMLSDFLKSGTEGAPTRQQAEVQELQLKLLAADRKYKKMKKEMEQLRSNPPKGPVKAETDPKSVLMNALAARGAGASDPKSTLMGALAAHSAGENPNLNPKMADDNNSENPKMDDTKSPDPNFEKVPLLLFSSCLSPISFLS